MLKIKQRIEASLEKSRLNPEKTIPETRAGTQIRG